MNQFFIRSINKFMPDFVLLKTVIHFIVLNLTFFTGYVLVLLMPFFIHSALNWWYFIAKLAFGIVVILFISTYFTYRAWSAYKDYQIEKDYQNIYQTIETEKNQKAEASPMDQPPSPKQNYF